MQLNHSFVSIRISVAISLSSHMMTKLKLNVYRAEDEFITMQRLQWRREEEENKKERKKVVMMVMNKKITITIMAG